jgi:hypothetical protein
VRQLPSGRGRGQGRSADQLRQRRRGTRLHRPERQLLPRRRPQAILNKLRAQPIFPGDALVDALPTLADIFIDANGQRVVTSPALFYHDPQPTALLATGRLDQLDSVGRQAPSMIGFAFNNRLLFGGIGGEVPSTPGSLNRSTTRLART